MPERVDKKESQNLTPLVAEDGGDKLKQLHLPMKEAALSIFYTAINTPHFHDDMYGHAKIIRPEHIEHSVIKRRAEYFYGRLCAQHALQKLGQGAQTVGTGPCRAPQWPARVLGSISHSNDFAAAAAIDVDRYAERYRGLGIDVEEVVADANRDALMNMALSTSELHCLSKMASSLPFDLLLTIVFSAKESFFKAAFPTVKRYFDFSALTLTELDLRQQSIKFLINEVLSTELMAGMSCCASYGFINARTVITAMLL